MIKSIPIFTLVALIWVSKLSFGQTELKVITFDSGRQPLPAVFVTIKSPASEKTIGVSDSIEITKFELTDTGTYTISAQFVGDIEKRELHLDTGSHAITIHFKRKELKEVLVEGETEIIEDGWGPSYPNFRQGRIFWAASVGGVWFPNTRAPTFDNLLNRQPSD